MSTRIKLLAVVYMEYGYLILYSSTYTRFPTVIRSRVGLQIQYTEYKYTIVHKRTNLYIAEVYVYIAY